jgi:hypothetical protein
MHAFRLGLGLALAGLGLSASAENLSPNLQINGFATAGTSWVSKDFGAVYLGSPFNKNRVGREGLTNDPAFDFDNVLGLQLNYQLDEQFDLVGQLVSEGKEGYTTQAEWAYVAYRYNDSLRFRAGRFAFPVYMYSETLHVGQSYPWARPPVELYAAVPLTNIDGADMLYRQALGDWNLDAQLYVGASSTDYAATRDSRGINLTLNNNALTLHAGYSQSSVDLNFTGLPTFAGSTDPTSPVYNPLAVLAITSNASASFADAGITYDDGSWFAAGEYGQLRLSGFVSDSDAGFVSVGHYFGKWLPYLMWSQANAVNGEQCINQAYPIFAGFDPNAGADTQAFCKAQQNEQTSYSLGFRYDVTKRVSLKGEVDHVIGLGHTPGLFSGVDSSNPPTGTDVFTFNVNAAF